MPYTVYEEGPDLYSVGDGLSGTTIDSCNPNVSPAQIPARGQVTVRMDVQASGKRAGDEVVELYARDVEASSA